MNKLYEKMVEKKESLSLVDLEYIGIPIAVAFVKERINIIGFYLNEAEITEKEMI